MAKTRQKDHEHKEATEGHKLLDKSDFKSVRSGAGSLPSYPTQRCDQHKSEVLNMYCQDHDEVACATCIGLNHRSCSNVYSVPDNVDNLYKKSEYSRVEHNINMSKTQIEDVKKSKETHIKALKISLKTAVDSVKTIKQELQTLLDKIEQQTMTELKKEYDRIKKSLEEEINEAEKQMDALNKMAAQLKHAEGNKSREFVCVKTSKKLTKFAEEKNKQHIQSDETVTFTAEQSIKSFLQQIKIFGKATSTQLATQKMQTGVVSKQTEVNVKVRDDIKKCDVCGSCITEDGTLLLLDYRNQKLKRMDITAQTVKYYLALISQGNAVCMVSETESAVSLNNMTVQLVLLEETMSASRTLTFNHHCWGLAYNNGKLFISNFGDSVYIHDMNCKELRKITKDGSGKCIFEFTRHIAISVGIDRLFVADSNNGLITLDMHGNYLYTLNNRDIGVSNLWGVCTDARYVYLCGRGPNNIIQLTPDAKFIEPIGTVKSSYSIAIDSGKSIIFVTKPDSDTITVLQFA